MKNEIRDYYNNNKLSMDSSEMREMLEDMTGVGEDKDYIVKMFEKLKEENKKLQEEKEDTLASLNFYQECNEELKEKIKKLKDNSIQYCES